MKYILTKIYMLTLEKYKNEYQQIGTGFKVLHSSELHTNDNKKVVSKISGKKSDFSPQILLDPNLQKIQMIFGTVLSYRLE